MKKILFLAIFLNPMAAFCQSGPDIFGQKVRTLKRFLEKTHYSPITWNDSSSRLLYDHWLEELDEEKLFFTQQDISRLEPFKTKLDDEINGKGGDFFRLSTQLFLTKIKKADSAVKSYLTRPVDISKPDQITWPFASYAANDGELFQRWQRYVKWRMLSSMTDEIAGKEEKKELPASLPAGFAEMEKRIRDKIRRRESMYMQSLMQTPESFVQHMQQAYLDAIAHTYDPHTTYMTFSHKEEFTALTTAKEFSSGFSFEEDDKGDKTISYLQPGGSAWRSGQVHAGDVILKVKSGAAEKDAADISDDELEDVLGDNSNSEVELTLRTASGEVKKVKLLREKITDDESIVKSYVVKGKQNIGYINLPGFYSNEEEDGQNLNGCANDVSKEIMKLKKDNIAGLVLDLRNNGGGSMWEAIQLAGIFIDVGPVASMKDEKGKQVFLKDPNRGTIYDGPMIILVNGASASASEFLSAALQDYNRALIVGGTTYGKGTAQDVLPLDTTLTANRQAKSDDYVKVTQGKFYRINGSTVQWKGVEPDIALPDLYSTDIFKEKAQPTALVPDQAKPGNYHAYSALPLQQLQEKSSTRINGDMYFSTVSKFAEVLASYNKPKNIPLQWAPYTQYYKRSIEAYNTVKEKEKLADALLKVENNSFDKDRIILAGKRAGELNSTYLEHISRDKELAEACNIFSDWIK